jgi:murein DD-endopeptidase MepM/ murein hydrolase activator NlpD
LRGLAVTVAAVALVVAGSAAAASPPTGDQPQLLPKVVGPLVGVPQLVTPALAAGPYVFPVYGSSSTIDSYGASESGLAYVHGDDIFGELGQPVVAAASGTLFSVGWNRVDGNRLSLRDHQGNLFSYANLAEFASTVRNGAHVTAGEVIGFMGNTGNTGGAATHLQFEVHPVSLLYLGTSGAVDPTGYLETWRRLANVPFPLPGGWAPRSPGVASAPEPGAVLISATDIASGGLAVAKR